MPTPEATPTSHVFLKTTPSSYCNVQLPPPPNFGLSLLAFVSVQVEVDSFAVSGSTYGKADPHGPQLLYRSESQSPPSAPTEQPVLAMGFMVGHKLPGSGRAPRRGWLPVEALTEPQSSVFDHHITVSLQQTVFVFDKQTALRLTDVVATLFNSFNAE